MSRILLFTDSFPYGTSETFLFPEVQIASELSVNLTILPFHLKGKKRKIPDNILVDESLGIAREKLHERKIWPIFFSIVKVVCGLYCHKVKSLRAIRDVSGFAHHSRIIVDWAHNYVDDEDILYTYWFERITYGLACYKEKYNKNNPLISRAHRFDLYEELRPHEFIPFRSFSLKYLNHLHLISNNAYKYIEHKYAGYKNIRLSKLGIIKNTFSVEKASQSISVVSCSSVIPVKRVDFIFECLQSYSTLSNRKITWIHFGEGSRMKFLKEKTGIKVANLEVKLMGHTNWEDILRFYQKNWVDLFINLSDTEGIPVSIMEAISFGIPVIARDVGGVSEIVNEQTGFLLSSDPLIEEVVSKLDHLIKVPKNRREVIDFFESNYSAQTNFKKFYSEITK